MDWKSTAKTGSLMLREMEAATDDDLTLLLNGAAADVAGELPDTTFEVAVQAAGAMAAYSLRSGHSVNLLLPENGWRPVRLSPGREEPAPPPRSAGRDRPRTGSTASARRCAPSSPTGGRTLAAAWSPSSSSASTTGW